MKNDHQFDNFLDIIFVNRDEILNQLEIIASKKNYRELILVIDPKHNINFLNNSLERIKIFRPNDVNSLFNFILSLSKFKNPRLKNIFLFDPFYLVIGSSNKDENLYLSTKKFYAFLINFLLNQILTDSKIHIIHNLEETNSQIILEISKFYNINLINSNDDEFYF